MHYLCLFVICPLLIIFSCKNETGTLNLSDCFYPVEEFEVPKVYVYESEDKSNRDYLELSYDAGSKELILKNYSWNCSPLDYAKLKLTQDGAFLQESYAYGDGGAIEIREILKDSVHLWNFTKPYSYALSYSIRGKTVLREVTSELLGEERINYKGQEINTLKYKETYDFRNSGGEIELSHFYLNYFAEGVGVVAYEWHRPGSIPNKFFLSKVIDMEAFGQLVQAYESVREN